MFQSEKQMEQIFEKRLKTKPETTVHSRSISDGCSENHVLFGKIFAPRTIVIMIKTSVENWKKSLKIVGQRAMFALRARTKNKIQLININVS